MAKLTTKQRAALFGNFGMADRARLTNATDMTTPAEMNKTDQTIMDSVDTARAHSQMRSWETHRATENAVAIPAGIPQRREDSGLVDDNMTLDESQMSALRVLRESPLTCLIGAAGTGKTTLVKRDIANHIYGGDGFQKRGIRNVGKDKLTIAVVAFTGKAMQVVKSTLPDWMASSVMTIHTLLEYKPAGRDENGEKPKAMFYPTRDAMHPLDQNRIYIDEASMLGLDLWHTLLNACRPGTEIILIGDLNQLVPVADSPFFPLVLESARNPDNDEWQLAELTTIHRQKGPGANRIIDTAHAILNGKRPEFDFELNAKGTVVDEMGKAVPNPSPNPDWRVINIHVDANTDTAHGQIAKWLAQFEKMEIKSESARVYKPYEDLVLTPGNGENQHDPSHLVQQIQLNATLSEVFVPESEDNPTYIIDAGRVTRMYTVGDRVMCNTNESPAVENRVTNGMLGVIKEIKQNGMWAGDKMRFGTKKEVQEWRRKVFEGKADAGAVPIGDSIDNMMNRIATSGVNTPPTLGESDRKEEYERQASHIVTIEYQNGQTRSYNTAAGVASTQLGYALTTHRAQGSQAETVFIIAHGAAKRQLNREWLYTAVTRAQKRVVVFSTSLGLRTGIARQQIFGKNLDEKITRYVANFNLAGKYVRLKPGM